MRHEVEVFINRYKHNPIRFVREILNAKPFPFQDEWSQSVADNLRVSVRACRGPGKTAWAAWMHWWFLATRPLSNVVVTAHTFERHIKDRFWPELRKWYRRADPILREMFEIEKFHVRVRDEVFRDEWFSVGTSSNEPDNMEGFHAPHLLFIVDEAKTVEREIFNAITGSLTDTSGEQKLLLISTPPEVPRGYFYDTCTKWRDIWETHHITAFEAMKQGARISPEWIEAQREELGEGSPAWQSQVLGEFPDQGEGVLIPISWIERAVRRHPLYEGSRQGESITTPSKPVEMGLDVSEGGKDNTVAAIRQGCVLWSLHQLRAGTSIVTAGDVAQLIRDWNEKYYQGEEWIEDIISQLKIERTGPGRGVGDLLTNKTWYIPSHRPRDRDTFHNLRAECWWALRLLFEKDPIAIPNNKRLIADLSSISYDYTQQQRVIIAQKDDLREILGRSPDDGDATMISFARLRRISGKTASVPI